MDAKLIGRKKAFCCATQKRVPGTRLTVFAFTILVSLFFQSGLNETLAQCEFQEDAKFTVPVPGADAWNVTSVSVSGDVAVVGAWGEHCAAGHRCGATYVYRFNGIAWIEQQKLTASDAGAEDRFGFSVAISGGFVVVGAYNDNCTTGSSCGSAYVFRFDGSTWVQMQKLSASNAAQLDAFGYSVAVSGNAVVVGSYHHDCAAGADCGAVYVYRFNGSIWVEEQILLAGDAAPQGLFGLSVSIDGEVILVGTLCAYCCADAGEHFCGSAYIFRFDGGSWFEEQRLTASDEADSSYFGMSVSISGNVAVVGAPYRDCHLPNCGSVYVFQFNENRWIQIQKIISSDVSPFDLFGWSVVVADDLMFVGSLFDDYDGCVSCGSVFAYKSNGNTWIEVANLTASDAAANNLFGAELGFSGGTLFVGAAHVDCAGAGICGAAYVFSVSDCDANGVLDACDPDLDGDSIPDICDNCPETPNTDQANADGDSNGDVCDLCPLDSPDDPDGDGVCSSDESCLNDPFKTEPGVCGCGIVDADSDGDIIADCNDICPGIDDIIFAPQCATAIPAVSSWGLIVLALCLLTAAKLKHAA